MGVAFGPLTNGPALAVNTASPQVAVVGMKNVLRGSPVNGDNNQAILLADPFSKVCDVVLQSGHPAPTAPCHA